MNVRLAALADLPQGGTKVEALGHRIALFRIEDDVYAIGDRCSHAEASLSEGEVFDLEVECPRHGSSFDLQTGEPHTFPATQPVPVYEITVVGGIVFADLEPIEEES
ncbi:MAG TPA: non-heme iron oxygenase ferredoxin subunit [Acidimicrobiia bacterium]|nr:non-heme iron oxygenase ferredoxin subunit [Acidimicrobiia bacterium]